MTHTARIRLLLGDDIAIGPGKVLLLDAIRTTGSISSAAKTLDMSYRRAWLLVETMNACFEEPLVEAVKGGAGGGGARITAAGSAVLGAFTSLQAEVDRLVELRKPMFASFLRKRKVAAPKR